MNPQTQITMPVEANPSLPPPQPLAVGTILTIRMQGHSRTDGQEYFAPAIVLDQYDNDQGSIEALVFDQTAGTHYQHSYPIRDLSTRGPGNELYVSRSNIGAILFEPDEFAHVAHVVGNLADRVMRIEARLSEDNAKVSVKDANVAVPGTIGNPAKIVPPIKPHEPDKLVR